MIRAVGRGKVCIRSNQLPTLASIAPPPQVNKPVVAWVSGTCAKLFKSEVQFGHAGARGGGADSESAEAKNAALRAVGAVVPDSFEGYEAAIRQTYGRLVEEGVIVPAEDVVVPGIPQDLEAAMKAGKVGARLRLQSGCVQMRSQSDRAPQIISASQNQPRSAPPPTWCPPSATTAARSRRTTASR